MKTNFQLRIVSIVELSIFLLLAAIFAGCEKDPVDNSDNPVNVVMQDVTLQGIVKDANGAPLSGVKVTTGSLSATTNNDGTFSFTQAGTVDNRAVIKFEKNGYFTLTRSGDKADEMTVEVVMYLKGNSPGVSLQTDFDAAKAKTLEIGGVTIDLPASAFVKADGSAFSGTVRADVLNIAPDNENASLLMPGGDLAAVRSDKSEIKVLPYGMMDAVFTGNDGNLLEIKEKTDVRITFPAPADVTTADLPATLPLWTFDEARGVWIEEGSAALQGNSYSGTVTHFTDHAVGDALGRLVPEMVTLQIQVKECDDKPGAGATILVDNYYNGRYFKYHPHFLKAFTADSKGYCQVEAQKYGTGGYEITVYFKGTEHARTVMIGTADTYSVSFEFKEDCGEEEGVIPAIFAIKFAYDRDNGGETDHYTEYLSWDNYGKRWRYDNQQNDDGVMVDVTDNLTHTNYHYENYGSKNWRGGGKPEDWSVWPIKGNDYLLIEHETVHFTITAGYTIAGKYYEYEWPPLENYKQRSATEMILGKACNVWENSASTVIWEWKKVIFRKTEKGKVTFQLLKITENVPTSAFTNQTIIPSWIE